MVVASSATRRGGGDRIILEDCRESNKVIMWYVYVLRSLKTNSLYVGSTCDIERRVREHNLGIGGGYTRKQRPFELAFYEAYAVKEDAVKAEIFFKSGYGREILRDKIKSYLKDTKLIET